MAGESAEVTNEEIAAILEGTAQLLELQQASLFRVSSYRKAADHLRALEEPIAERYRRSGEAALRQLEGVGPKLAASLREILEGGPLDLRGALEGELSPQALFCQVPGIGPVLAGRIHDELGLTSLEELEQAALSGSLTRIEGIGTRRLKEIQNVLAGMLKPSLGRHAPAATEDLPIPAEGPPADRPAPGNRKSGGKSTDS